MTESHSNPVSVGSRRATRFTIRMRLLYRQTGEATWLQGMIENISRSGLLFHGEQPLEPKTTVEMRFGLPVEALGEPAAEIVCKGKIVRLALFADDSNTRHELAATILRSRFVRAVRHNS